MDRGGLGPPSTTEKRHVERRRGGWSHGDEVHFVGGNRERKALIEAEETGGLARESSRCIHFPDRESSRKTRDSPIADPAGNFVFYHDRRRLSCNDDVGLMEVGHVRRWEDVSNIGDGSNEGIEAPVDAEALQNLREQRRQIKNRQMQPLSRPNIAGLTSIFAGIECVWSVIISRVTPQFRDLGVPELLLSMVWLVGPLAGLIVQPVVGVLSDQCESRYGRRRPFIIVGALCEFLGMILLLMASNDGLESNRWSNITVAFLGFTLVSVAHNMIQGPARALLVDLASVDGVDDHQAIDAGNAGFALWMSIGQGVGFLAGSVDWAPYLTQARTHQPVLGPFSCNATCINLRFDGAISLVVLFITTLICCYVATEVPKVRDRIYIESTNVRPERAVFKAFRFVRLMPTPMKRVCLVVFLSWVGFSQLFVHITDWVGKDVACAGSLECVSAQSPNYFEGVRRGTRGLFFNSLLASVTSIALPRMTHLGGLRGVWVAGNACLAIGLLLTPYIRRVSSAIVLIGAMGVPWAVTMSVPFSLIGIFSNEMERAVAIGVLNTYIVVPFVLVALLDGPLIVAFGGRISSVLVGGGFFAALSCVFVLFIPLRKEGEGQRVTLPHTPSMDTFSRAVRQSSLGHIQDVKSVYGSIGRASSDHSLKSTSSAGSIENLGGGSRSRTMLSTLAEDYDAELASTTSPK